MRLLEPEVDNISKMIQIEKQRITNGENWSDEIVFPIHSIGTTGDSFMVIETSDQMKLAKYRADYLGVLGIEIHEIMDYGKLRDLYKSKEHNQVVSV